MSGQHCENYDVKQEIVHCYPQNVYRCSSSLVNKLSDYLFSTDLSHLLCHITNHLMTGPLGNSEFCFPRFSMFQTLRFSGNKIHCSPRNQSLSVYYIMNLNSCEIRRLNRKLLFNRRCVFGVVA